VDFAKAGVPSAGMSGPAGHDEIRKLPANVVAHEARFVHGERIASGKKSRMHSLTVR
jgi:hypothetical protein